MKILVSGSTGLIGSSLQVYLGAKGHVLKALVRHAPANPSEIRWNPAGQGPTTENLEGVDAVVHLAGDSIAEGRWTEAKKKAIFDSRAIGTRVLAESLARMKTPPKVLICASAIGYYGDRRDEILEEDSPAGAGFLPDVCRAWEAATQPASDAGIRVVNLRFGIILSPKGGALKQMLMPFKAGVGGKIGTGTQYMSWIALDDVLAVIAYAIDTMTLRGPVNTVSPTPVTNAEFTKTLGRVLRRPTILPMPAAAAKLVFGEMAEALLLSSARVVPNKLIASGYHFQWPDLEGTFRHLLNK
jgi:uncharacterized protein